MYVLFWMRNVAKGNVYYKYGLDVDNLGGAWLNFFGMACLRVDEANKHEAILDVGQEMAVGQ